MSRYRCRRCPDLPVLALRSRGRGPAVCGHCGSVLERRPWFSTTHQLALALTLTGLSLVVLPDAMDGLAVVATALPGLSGVVARLDPPPEPARRPLALLQGDLVDRLAEADLAWIPTVEPLPGGGVRYLYRRRLGEPQKDVDELRALIAQPPDHGEERQAITDLLQALQRVGVAIELAPPRRIGAGGEWDHASRTIRIQPTVVGKGTVEFARVLNHESIHVAQSCVSGGIRARPSRLGLDTAMPEELAQQLSEPMYDGIPARDKTLEQEAYANQHRLELGAALVRRHCPVSPSLS